MTDARPTLIPPTPDAEDYKASDGGGAEDMFSHEDPLALFSAWLAEAGETEVNDPNAVALATVDAHGLPDVRMVLLKGLVDLGGEYGFVVYSHSGSAKGVQMAANPRAAMCFHWKSLRRQVRLRGEVRRIEGARADAYFAERARLSQIGAWASQQSRELESREVLRERIAAYDARFGDDVPRPEGWIGYALVPDAIEFWADRPYRLHDRLQFVRDGQSGGWTRHRLYP